MSLFRLPREAAVVNNISKRLRLFPSVPRASRGIGPKTNNPCKKRRRSLEPRRGCPENSITASKSARHISRELSLLPFPSTAGSARARGTREHAVCGNGRAPRTTPRNSFDRRSDEDPGTSHSTVRTFTSRLKHFLLSPPAEQGEKRLQQRSKRSESFEIPSTITTTVNRKLAGRGQETGGDGTGNPP